MDVLPAYRERIVGDIRSARPAEDRGGFVATAWPVHQRARLFARIGCEVHRAVQRGGWQFPQPPPRSAGKPENLRDLIAALQAKRRRAGPGL